MGRRCEWLRPAGPAAAPCNILVFDCESWHGDKALEPGGEWHTLRLGCALAYRLVRGKRTRVRRITFADSESFWAFVKSRQCKRNPLWVFAHNLHYDMGIVDGWRRLFLGEYCASKVAITQTLAFLKGEYDGKPLNLCDTTNYFHCRLKEVGASIGIPKLEMPNQDDSDAAWQRYCENDVEVTAAGLDALIRFVRSHELGPWGPTIASLAFRAFRARFMPKKTIALHKHPEAIKLERAAYYGGIVECNFIGKVDGPVHEVDVCSMYPAQCLKPVPTRLIAVSDHIGTLALTGLLQDRAVIAEVELSSSNSRYPVRTRYGTVYPHGRYCTTLAGPELSNALREGSVKWVHRAAWYAQSPVMADYMKFFTDKKREYANGVNPAFYTIAKYYANSLYGKWGQLTPIWQEWNADSLRQLEKLYGVKPGTLEYSYNDPPDLYSCEQTHRLDGLPESVRCREYYGIVEVRTGYDESRESFPAIAAYVTSYARMFLRHCQAICGVRNWFYSDTDSLWVNDAGLRNLRAARLVGDGRLGLLDYKRTVEWMVIHGPKDYETPAGVKLKGIKPTTLSTNYYGDIPVKVLINGDECYFLRTPDGGYRQVQFPSALAQIKGMRFGGVFVKHQVKKLYRRQTRWTVNSDGWTSPLQMPMTDDNKR